ncbi:response regulator transcription factor [Lachnospira multipara]|uniref:Stage 0 sporulation protein A homolog n=1 Tax=Lachnospira multipara TaxID=28051 RepID=A0A1H5TLP5_9FIRM|nr:response regulator transcription factor [Lachnospira multipara]SEF63696.1 DNA-binding response regulator, NarL/FixJ family, contains REC and HTH domains [Lachnospira multipara]
MQKSILLIDDDELITMSLEMIISSKEEFKIVGKGHSGREAIDFYEELKPDLVLMDIRMEGMNGLEAAREILKKHPEATILFLTTFSDDEYIIEALKLGVRGYLLKQDYKALDTALTAAINGQSVFGGTIINKLPKLMQGTSAAGLSASDAANLATATLPSFDYAAADITDKEFAVIQLVADGYSNKEIAGKLFLSEGTVRNYLSTILEKLDLRDRTQLAIFYLKNI